MQMLLDMQFVFDILSGRAEEIDLAESLASSVDSFAQLSQDKDGLVPLKKDHWRQSFRSLFDSTAQKVCFLILFL